MAGKVARKLRRRLPAADLDDSMMVITIVTTLTILRYPAELRSTFPLPRNDLFQER